MTIMSILKGIPHSYNRDLQEITPHLWSAVDNTNDILQIVHGMLATLTINKQRTAELAGANFATATELADVMVREKNMPFRTAHNIVGRVVSDAIEQNLKATDLDDEFINQAAIEVTGKPVDLGDELVKQALNPALNVKARTVRGGPAPSAVKDAIKNMESFLN